MVMIVNLALWMVVRLTNLNFYTHVIMMDWAIKGDPNGSLMMGGLCSPCLNSHYFVDCVDRVG